MFFLFLLLTVYICLCVCECFLCNFVLFVFAMGRVAWNKPVMMIPKKCKYFGHSVNVFRSTNNWSQSSTIFIQSYDSHPCSQSKKCALQSTWRSPLFELTSTNSGLLLPTGFDARQHLCESTLSIDVGGRTEMRHGPSEHSTCCCMQFSRQPLCIYAQHQCRHVHTKVKAGTCYSVAYE